MQCNSCGAPYPDNSPSCPHCGQPNQFQGNPQNFGQPNQFQGNPQNFGQPNQFQGNPQNFGQPNQFQGNPQNFGQPNPYQNAYPGGAPSGPPMTKSQFFKLPGMNQFRSSLIGAACLAYFCAAITFIFALITNPLSILDAAILLGLALGMHLGRSRACAFVMLGYSIFNFIYAIIGTHTLGGWLIILAAVLGCIATCKMHAAYKSYIQTGFTPYA